MRTLVAACLFFVFGCGERPPTTVVESPLTGNWTADTGTVHFSLVLEQSDSNVTGGGAMFSPNTEAAPPAPVEIHGQRAKNDVRLEWILPEELLDFSGSVVALDEIQGVLKWPGQGEIAITLLRRPR